MNPEGHISGDTLTVLWRSVSGTVSYSLAVERCDQDNVCDQVFHKFVPENEEEELVRLTETSQEFAPCTFYNLILKALSSPSSASSSAKLLMKETATLRKPPRECDRAAQAGLVVALCVLGVLVILCAAALFYYHRRRPINRIQRVRSKVYSRLYSKDRYERPVPKREFVKRVGELLEKEAESEEDCERDHDRSPSSPALSPLRVEFEELERLSFDTIQRRATAADLAVNRMRNRYSDIVPYDANRVRLNEPLALEGASEASDYVNASAVGDVASQGGAYPALVGGGGSFSRTTPVR